MPAKRKPSKAPVESLDEETDNENESQGGTIKSTKKKPQKKNNCPPAKKNKYAARKTLPLPASSCTPGISILSVYGERSTDHDNI